MKIMNDEDYRETREYVANIEGLLLELRRTHSPEGYDFVKASWLRKVREAQADVERYLSEPVAAPASSERTAAKSG